MKKLTQLCLLAIAFVLLQAGRMNAQCSASFNYTPGLNGAYQFSSTSTPANSITTQYYWSFGNGNTFTATGSPIANTTFTANGTYTVTLFFITVPSCSNQVTSVITVSNVTNPCNLQAVIVTSLTNTPGVVNIYHASTGTVSNSNYSWNFGDGSTSVSPFGAQHTYSANGTYTVTLTVSNNTIPPCISTATAVVNVTNYCTLVAGISHTVGNNGLVTFNSTSTGTTPATSFKWLLGPGGMVFGPNAAATYVNGTYTVTLLLQNGLCFKTATQVIVVNNNTCNITPSFSYSQGTNGVVNLVNTTTGAGSNATYTWNLGNGTISNLASPSATYLAGGYHFVTLTVNNGAGCSAVISNTVMVQTLNCLAIPAFTLLYAGTPGYWNATPSYPWSVVNAVWSWGDATSTNALYPSHTYSTSGNYQICLTVTVTCGQTASACATYSIYRSSGASIYQVNVVPPELKNNDENNTTGLVGVSRDELKASVYPNPVSGEAALMVSGLKAENSKIRVMDATGREIINVTHQNQNGNLIEIINLQDHPSGVYFITVQSGSDLVTRKIILNK